MLIEIQKEALEQVRDQALLKLPVRKHKLGFKAQQIYKDLLADRMLTSEERKKFRWMIEYSRYDADMLAEYYAPEKVEVA